jgi:hypothetical protein
LDPPAWIPSAQRRRRHQRGGIKAGEPEALSACFPPLGARAEELCGRLLCCLVAHQIYSGCTARIRACTHVRYVLAAGLATAGMKIGQKGIWSFPRWDSAMLKALTLDLQKYDKIEDLQTQVINRFYIFFLSLGMPYYQEGCNISSKTKINSAH